MSEDVVKPKLYCKLSAEERKLKRTTINLNNSTIFHTAFGVYNHQGTQIYLDVKISDPGRISRINFETNVIELKTNSALYRNQNGPIDFSDLGKLSSPLNLTDLLAFAKPCNYLGRVDHNAEQITSDLLIINQDLADLKSSKSSCLSNRRDELSQLNRRKQNLETKLSRLHIRAALSVAGNDWVKTLKPKFDAYVLGTATPNLVQAITFLEKKEYQ